MDQLQELSFVLISALQSLSPALDGVMNLFSFLGRVEFYLLLLPFIYLAVDRRVGFRTLLVLVFTDILGGLFKVIFHQPRPYWLRPELQLATETSYGIPSTHASDSFAVWGYLAYRLRKAWLWILAGLMVFFIGLSRLYLGVHFLHDVLLGWLIGLVVIVIFVLMDKKVSGWARGLSLGVQIGMSLAVSVVIILLGQLVHAWAAGIVDPQGWRQLALESRTINYAYTLAGSFFGATAGYALMRRYAPFSSQGKWSLRIGRYLIGVIGVLVIYFGLDAGFSMITGDETALGYLLRAIRYASVNFWLVFLAPLLFLKIRLAEKEKQGNS